MGLAMLAACSKDEDNGGGGTDFPTLTISDVSRFEGDEPSTFDFKVRLSKAIENEVSFDFTTSSLNAQEVTDYEKKEGRITIAAGDIEETISINIVADTIKEGDEEFEVILSNPENAIILESVAVGTIRNDDDFVQGTNDGYTTPDSYAGFTLVWRDEFNGPSINLNDWTHELGNSGWGNNELQNYTSSSNNSYISDGKLVIEAREENSNGSSYSSARMVTQDKQEFQFGRIDIRARLPEGQGIWPALWMLGSNFSDVGWPACGEIDIMELVGHEPSTVHGTAHWGAQGQGFSNSASADITLSSGKFIDEYHVFSIIWDQDRIRWYMDDTKFHEINRSGVVEEYRFNQPFFFIFNVAVGGNWPGNPDNTTVFPQRMFVDYVRVFQKN